MATPGERPLQWKPRSVCDTVDGDDSPPGAMYSLRNLIPDPSTPNCFICRPANTQQIDFSSLGGGVVSDAYQVSGIIYGLIGIVNQPYIYVANLADGTVSVLNPNTSTVVKTITVGGQPFGVAVSPDGSTVWVANSASGSVSVISTATNTVIVTIITGGIPFGIAFTPSGATAYVTNDSSSGKVWPINTATYAIGTPISVGARPNLIAITADGLKAYVTNKSDGTVSVITIASNTVTSTITVGSNPVGIAAAPNSAHVYVANVADGTVSVIATVSETVVATVTVGSLPTGLAVTLDGASVYVGNKGGNSVSVITTASNTVTHTISGLASGPVFVAMTPDGLYAVLSLLNSTMVPITISSFAIGTAIPTGNSPQVIAIASFSFVGKDRPFAYSISTGAFLPISGVTVANCPTSQATTGAWVPPQMTLTGVDLVVAHIGFDGVTNFFGYFNLLTPTAPVWTAGNTATNGLPSVPQAVQTFNNRTYFFCGNVAFYTDTLALSMATSNQSFTIGDYLPITAAAPLPVGTTSQGIVQGILAFKLTNVTLITGDAVTMNLATNLLSPSVGTAAPRSVVSTPEGVKFMANDGARNINFFGVLSEPDADLAMPFIYALIPSRVAAAFNADTYRICTQNGNAANSPYQDYWYSFRYRKWTGPHDFRYDLAIPYSNDFILFSNSLPGTGWYSYSVQGHAGAGNTFIENGQQLTFDYITPPMTDGGNLFANSCNRATIDMATPASGQTYNCTAQDENGSSLATASLTTANTQTIWGSFTWGLANWGAALTGLIPITIPWNQTIVTNKLSIIINGQCALGMRIGSLKLLYKPLKYFLH